MENIKQVIGKKLHDRRVEKGFKTQKALADSIGVDRTRVVRWESGENTPDPLYKELLCQKLDVPMSFFETIETAPLTTEKTAPTKPEGDKSRAESILKIIALLPALNESQIGNILKLASGYAGNVPDDIAKID